MASGGVQVAEGVILTIEPGVTILVTGGSDIFVYAGEIVAIGTGEQPITFDQLCEPSCYGLSPKLFVSVGDLAKLTLEHTLIQNMFQVWQGGPDISIRESYVRNVPGRAEFIGSKNFIAERTAFENVGRFRTAHSIKLLYNCFKGQSPGLFQVSTRSGPGSEVKYNTITGADSGQSTMLTWDTQGVSTKDVDATHNYWAGLTEEQVGQLIRDNTNDIRMNAKINYLPLLSEPHPDAPSC